MTTTFDRTPIEIAQERHERRQTDDPLCEVWQSGLGIQRSITVVMRRATLPAVRMTQRSKFANPKAQEYLAWKEGTAGLVLIKMREASIKPFPKGTKLKMDVGFDLAPAETLIRATSYRPHMRTIHPAATADVDNLFKGIADAMKGVLYGDDRCIYEARMTKREADKDWTEIWVREL